MFTPSLVIPFHFPPYLTSHTVSFVLCLHDTDLGPRSKRYHSLLEVRHSCLLATRISQSQILGIWYLTSVSFTPGVWRRCLWLGGFIHRLNFYSEIFEVLLYCKFVHQSPEYRPTSGPAHTSVKNPLRVHQTRPSVITNHRLTLKLFYTFLTGIH